MFSICVPVYNVEEYLDQCMETLLSQDGGDFEIILVDDGSTDGSPAKCDAYSSANPGIVKVVHQDNAGLFCARRTAFAVACGDYVVCVDSDDMLRDDALARIRETIGATSADVVFFDWSRELDFSRDRVGLGICEAGRTVSVSKDDVLNLLFSSRKINNMWIHAVRRNCINLESAMRMSRKLQYGEDLYWNVLIYEKAATFAYVAEPLYFYRPNNKSITHTFSESRLEDVRISRSGLRALARKVYTGSELEEALQQISSVDLMQVVDLVQMICLSNRSDKTTLLEELRCSDLYQCANVPSTASLIPRVDYRMQLVVFRRGRFRALTLLVRFLSWIYPAALSVRRLIRWA